MYKIIFLLSFIGLTYQPAKSQYYYRDLISIQQINTEMAAYKKANIRKVKIKSFDDKGNLTEDLFVEKKISKDYLSAKTNTSSINTATSLIFSSFDKKGLLYKMYDTSESIAKTHNYFYDSLGNLVKTIVNSVSRDDDYVVSMSEEHLYILNQKHLPEKMFCIKNKTDSLEILFGYDENNNLAIEKNTRTGALYYYYYDSSNRLTDIVHMHEYKKRMIADYVFEYDDQNNITQMTTIEEGSNEPTTWKYKYNGNLKISEQAFDKDNLSLGKVEYIYSD